MQWFFSQRFPPYGLVFTQNPAMVNKKTSPAGEVFGYDQATGVISRMFISV